MPNWDELLHDKDEGVYIYDLTALKERAKSLSVSRHRIFYAVKANSDSRVLKTLMPFVDGFEVASRGEIEKVRMLSHDVPIIFGGPVKTQEDLKYAIEHGVTSFNVESLFELDELQTFCMEKDCHLTIQLRINLADIKNDATLKMAGVTQFGLPEEDFIKAVELIQSSNNMELSGFHFHAMSNNMDVKNHLAYVRTACDFVKRHQQLLPPEPVINVGGGFGIDYQQEKTFDMVHFMRQAEEMPLLTFEIGRWLTGPVGYYAARVYDIKQMHGQNFVLPNGGTYHFRFPKAWFHQHPFLVIKQKQKRSRRKTLQQVNAVIAGKLCTPNDVFGPAYYFEDIATDDLIVFKFAGAYGREISHLEFLSHAKPEILYI
ncbi:alanine racemase [Macrococcus brunensis]|uniref:alanine racemase n=1 Tax=Macrococcus brunensis TaxID=198483 RepID=UPI001EEFD8AA|nr:alanine racemase [Macrococcus brunensis]ULG72246.1 alanine racemase [Macrococcus brunensis]